MKREIKFRVWSDFQKQFLTDNGSVFLRDVGDVYNSKYIQQSNLSTIFEMYTGRKDKNGIEIYEGDLLVDPYPVDEDDLSKGYYKSFLPVVWCSSTLQWCVDASFAKDGSFLTSLVEYFGDELEVVGNIHQSETELKA